MGAWGLLANPWAWVAAAYALWVLYVMVMGLHRARLAGRLSRVAFTLGLPFVALGVLLDVLINWTLAALLLLELPRWKEWTVSQRLTRHLAAGQGWRFKLAKWLCTHLLDPFDPSGAHCDG